MAGTDFQVQIFSSESSFKIIHPSSKYSEILPSPQENFISILFFSDLICSLRIPSEFCVGISSMISFLQELKSIAVKINCEIFGISKDSLNSHKKFKKKYGIKFDLLSDENKEIIKRYKVWGKKKFMGREFMGLIRSTFLIDKKGKIIKIWKNVKVKDHAKEVLEALKDLNK